ncbi:beta family protein [Priestia koreensis]|nr:hypothetical protein [Priestia koreensis]
MKTRAEELNVISKMNNYFSDSMIPLIEIIREEYDIKFEKNAETGEYIYEKKQGKKRRSKVKLPTTDDDIITLNKISERLNGKKAFVDFFRFNEREYDNKTFKNIELAIRLSRDYGFYKKRMLEIKDFQNFIPVISIKEGFAISKYDLINLINELRKHNTSIAIRITDNYLEDYYEVLEDHLTPEDYILLDIRDKHVDSKFLEIEELQDLETDAKKILLNSPRSRNHKNGDFENLLFTKKIDNKVAVIYKDYDLDGFGDFGGLKDVLPEEGGSNGMGAALGLIFSKEKNAFFSVVNNQTILGVKGFEYVRSEILKRLQLLDVDGSCTAIRRIKEMDKTFGNWGTWNNLTLTRYIQQQAKNK